VNRSKFTEREAFNEQRTKFKSYKVGMQISSDLDSQVS